MTNPYGYNKLREDILKHRDIEGINGLREEYRSWEEARIVSNEHGNEAAAEYALAMMQVISNGILLRQAEEDIDDANQRYQDAIAAGAEIMQGYHEKVGE